MRGNMTRGVFSPEAKASFEEKEREDLLRSLMVYVTGESGLRGFTEREIRIMGLVANYFTERELADEQYEGFGF